MSFATYPWDSAAQIREHFHEKRRACFARYEAESVRINREESEALHEHRKILALAASNPIAEESER